MGTYDILLQRIVSHMKLLSEEKATALAFKITETINFYLADTVMSDEDKTIIDLIPYSVRSRALLSIGWDALRVCKNIYEQERSKITFLSTMPLSYRLTNEVSRLRIDSGIWAGSLLSSISEIINLARNELFIIAPYWSSAGVKSLVNNLDRSSRKGLSVFIFTQPKNNLRVDEIEAIKGLFAFFTSVDAKVAVFAPNFDEDSEPLLHAKAVIADGTVAYLGSANYTASGMERSIEIGIRVEGCEVNSLNSWASFLMNQFSKWD